MKKTLLIFALFIISNYSFAQWTTSGSNIYYNTGNVGIGTASPGSLLSIGGNPGLLTGTQLAISFAPTGTSGTYGGITNQVLATPAANTSATIDGIYSQVGTGTGAFNFTARLTGVASGVSLRGTGLATSICAFWALSPAFTSTGTATSSYGILINPQRIAGVSAAYGVYEAGATDSNYFAGSVGVGTIPSGAKFTVNQSVALGTVAQNNSLLTSTIGTSSNHFMNNVWLVRNAAGNDWTTARLHDGISIDATYTTPQVNTRTWWERDPHADIQSWGTAANTYFSIIQGKVGVNTTYIPTAYQFAVNGAELATSVTVLLRSSWPDYVFKKDYKLPLLTQVKAYVDQNHHLPGLPSAEQVAKDGLDLGEVNKQLTKKVEELTLYLIQQKEEIEQIKKEVEQLKSKQ